MHARTVDDAVLRWVKETTTMTNGNENTRERVSLASALFGGGSDSKKITPDWNRVRDASVFSRATRSSGVLPALIEIGNDLAAEQERVMQTRLVEEYMPGVRLFGDKKSARASEEKKLAEKRARALLERERAAAAAAHAASESTRAAAESARAALAKASRENPREALRLESPAERAARANKRRAEATTSEVANGDGGARRNAGGWTILDGGATSEASVTEKPEYDAFDTMDWG
jgi:membrane protein involved in colicin uptake